MPETQTELKNTTPNLFRVPIEKLPTVQSSSFKNTSFIFIQRESICLLLSKKPVGVQITDPPVRQLSTVWEWRIWRTRWRRKTVRMLIRTIWKRFEDNWWKKIENRFGILRKKNQVSNGQNYCGENAPTVTIFTVMIGQVSFPFQSQRLSVCEWHAIVFVPLLSRTFNVDIESALSHHRRRQTQTVQQHRLIDAVCYFQSSFAKSRLTKIVSELLNFFLLCGLV